MIWPLPTEAARLAEEKRKRRSREMEEVSGQIKRLSEDIVHAMNCQKMLLPVPTKKTRDDPGH